MFEKFLSVAKIQRGKRVAKSFAPKSPANFPAAVTANPVAEAGNSVTAAVFPVTAMGKGGVAT